MKEFILTQEGYDLLQAEYRQLIDVERPSVIEQLQNARQMGDLSENADYDAARDRQSKIEGRIAEIEAILNNAKIVEAKSTKTVNVSNVVTFRDLSDNTEMTVRIVSSIESDPITDPNNIKISNECPLGEALMGHKVNDQVTVKATPKYDVLILEIK